MAFAHKTLKLTLTDTFPKGLSVEQKAVAQWSAHLAVERPFECSPIDVVDIATKVSVSEQGEKK